MLLDHFEKSISLDLTNHQKIISIISETMLSIWSKMDGLNDPGQFSQILIFGSDRLFIHIELIQQIFNNFYDIPVKFTTDNDQKIVIQDNSLIITFNLENNHPIFDFLFNEKITLCKKIVVNSAIPSHINLSKFDFEFLFIEELRDESIKFEYLITFLIKIFEKNKSISPSLIDFSDICLEIKELIAKIDFEIPTSRNPAKRLAGQLVDRMIVVIGSNFLCPIAKYWKEQLNTISKTWAQYEFLPEMGNTSINGIYFPEKILSQSIFIFLNSNLLDDESKNKISIAKEIILSAGIGTDEVLARGESYLSQILNLCVFGTYVAFYLAVIYEVDSL